MKNYQLENMQIHFDINFKITPDTYHQEYLLRYGEICSKTYHTNVKQTNKVGTIECNF